MDDMQALAQACHVPVRISAMCIDAYVHACTSLVACMVRVAASMHACYLPADL